MRWWRDRVRSQAVGASSDVSFSKKGAMEEQQTGDMQRDFRGGERGMREVLTSSGFDLLATVEGNDVFDEPERDGCS